MASIEEMVKASSCFGLAYDGSVPECKVCEVKLKCESKCRMGQATKPQSIAVATPGESINTSEVKNSKNVASVPVVPADGGKKPKKATTANPKLPKKATNTTPSAAVNYAADMPQSFKDMSMEQLEELAQQRGCDLSEFEKYTAANIRRMRLTMAIKKTYEV